MSFFFSEDKEKKADRGRGSIFDPSDKSAFESPAKFSGSSKPRSSPLTDSPVPWKITGSKVPDNFQFQSPFPSNNTGNSLKRNVSSERENPSPFPGGNSSLQPTSLKRSISNEREKHQLEFNQESSEETNNTKMYTEGKEDSSGDDKVQLSREGQGSVEVLGGMSADGEHSRPDKSGTAGPGVSLDHSSVPEKKIKMTPSDGANQSSRKLLEGLLDQQRGEICGLVKEVEIAELKDEQILVNIGKISQDIKAYSEKLSGIKEQYRTRLATVSSFLSKGPGQ